MAQKVPLTVALNEYREHMAARGLAPSTVRDRYAGIAQFIKVTGDIYVDNITHKHLDRVFAACHWQPSTRNNRLGQFKAFFAWCRSRKYMARDNDPTFGYRNVKVVDKHRKRVPVLEWEQLFSACVHPLERIVIATGLFLFLRGSEQQGIQLKHVRLDDMEIDIYRRKTREWDTMPISAELAVYLREHLTWLATQGIADPEHYLIPARNRDLDRHPATGKLIAGTGSLNPERPFIHPHRVVQRVLARAGWEETLGEGEHTLRRSGARAYFDVLAESGYDGALRRVQAMLGHKSSSMTEVYLGLDLDRRARNEDIKGQPMFPVLSDAAKVVRLREAQ